MKNRLWVLTLVLCTMIGLSAAAPCPAQTNAAATVSAAEFWGVWPQNADPNVLGKRVVTELINRPTLATQTYGMIYPEVCAGYGSLRFAGATGDQQLLADLMKRYQGMLLATNPATQPAAPVVAAVPATQPDAAAAQRGGRGRGGRGGRGARAAITPATAWAGNIIPKADHVDHSVFGTLPLEIFQINGDPRYLAIGKKSADDQWLNPIAGGLTNQSRFWIDDMFMITAVQTNAYRASKDPIYLDHAATQMAAYLDKLQQPGGLFQHADDVPAYWGRGDGWVAAGLTELLTNLPKDHPLYPKIMAGYQKMMAALLKYQGPDGMWRELIDHADSWPETSGTGMFVFAMASGVRNGWLDAAQYKEPARKAWIGLSAFLTDAGQVRDVCVGTNKYDMKQGADGMVAYYQNRGKVVGDLHGQAAFVWAAWAMVR